MRRPLALFLAVVTVATSLGAGLAVTSRSVSLASPAPSIAAFGPHFMLPNPDAYPTAPFTQPSGWTGVAPGTRAGGPSTLGVQPGLVTEAGRAADSTVDFSRFDGDGDGVVDHIIVVHAGDGEESNTNSPNLIWSHRWAVVDADPSIPGDQRLMADGVQVYGYSMDAEFSPLGVFAHELGHDLGLPDLYDTDGSSLGVGVWDVMGTGSWNGSPRGTSPAEMSAWAKVMLGGIAPTAVGSALLRQSLGGVEANPPGVQAPT